MHDREKAIEGLLSIKKYLDYKEITTTDAFEKAALNGSIKDIDDAILLLKEQEAKTGHWISVNDGDVVAIDNDGVPERACFCSQCKQYLTASDEYAVYGRYCPFCGVKMEGR